MGVDDVGDVLEGELVSGHADEFGDYHSNGGKHGGAAVFEFGFAEPGDPFWGTLWLCWVMCVRVTIVCELRRY